MERAHVTPSATNADDWPSSCNEPSGALSAPGPEPVAHFAIRRVSAERSGGLDSVDTGSPSRSDAYPGVTVAPLAYPGTKPAGSYLYYDGRVYDLLSGDTLRTFRVRDREQEVLLDEFLVSCGSAAVGNRHPVLAVGSNGCPGRLSEKFGLGRSSAIPVIVGTAIDTASVYSRSLTGYGVFPATYIRRVGARARLAVTLLDEEQLRQMDESERVGLVYSRVALQEPFLVSANVVIEGTTSYLDPRILSLNGTPVLLSAFDQQGVDWPRLSEIEVLSSVLDAAEMLLGQSIEARHECIIRDPSTRIAVQRFADEAMSGLRVDAHGSLLETHEG